MAQSCRSGCIVRYTLCRRATWSHGSGYLLANLISPRPPAVPGPSIVRCNAEKSRSIAQVTEQQLLEAIEDAWPQKERSTQLWYYKYGVIKKLRDLYLAGCKPRLHTGEVGGEHKLSKGVLVQKLLTNAC